MEKGKNTDFDDLKEMKLSPEIIESIKQARIEAKDIIEFLEPHGITSWADLISKLEIVLNKAKLNAEQFRFKN
jgi:hypothetical protein